jgi:hypothetical protein
MDCETLTICAFVAFVLRNIVLRFFIFELLFGRNDI